MSEDYSKAIHKRASLVVKKFESGISDEEQQEIYEINNYLDGVELKRAREASKGFVTPEELIEDCPDDEIKASLLRSLEQARKGELIPVNQLWDGIDDEEPPWVKHDYDTPGFAEGVRIKSYSLEELLAGITEDNLHGEI
jgi:hypothetical protein